MREDDDDNDDDYRNAHDLPKSSLKYHIRFIKVELFMSSLNATRSKNSRYSKKNSVRESSYVRTKYSYMTYASEIV